MNKRRYLSGWEKQKIKEKRKKDDKSCGEAMKSYLFEKKDTGHLTQASCFLNVVSKNQEKQRLELEQRRIENDIA